MSLRRLFRLAIGGFLVCGLLAGLSIWLGRGSRDSVESVEVEARLQKHRQDLKDAQARLAPVLRIQFIIFVSGFALILFWAIIGRRLYARIRPPSPTPLSSKASPEYEAIWPLVIQSTRDPPTTRRAIADTTDASASYRPPAFKCLRAKLTDNGTSIGISLRCLLLNTASSELVLDDVHVAMYEKSIKGSYPLTIGYVTTHFILNTNTIQKKDGVTYSCAPGDGGEYDFELQLTIGDGAARYVFGLVADYYFTVESQLARGTVSSDSIFLVTHNSTVRLGIGTTVNRTTIVRIDDECIQFLRTKWRKRADYLSYVDQCDDLLRRHRASLRTLRA
jgi:hypothetical protein